jgi:hypothetical protein
VDLARAWTLPAAPATTPAAGSSTTYAANVSGEASCSVNHRSATSRHGAAGPPMSVPIAAIISPLSRTSASASSGFARRT